MYQRTIRNIVQTEGIGLHSGQQVLLTLKPAEVNTGIVFLRVDLPENPSVAAKVENIVEVNYSTTIASSENPDCRVSTIEHLMAALAALGIDNLLIEINHAEVPIMDGSSAPFVFLLQSSGVIDQKVERTFLKVIKEVVIRNKEAVASVTPFEGSRFSYTLNYDLDARKIFNSSIDVDFSTTSFVNTISRARTFGFQDEISYLLSQGLAKGGSLENAILIEDNKVLNLDGFRLKDELVKHKVLDMIGDFYLAGFPILGHFSGYRTGHSSNKILLEKLLSSEDNYEFVKYPLDAQPIVYTSYPEELSVV